MAGCPFGGRADYLFCVNKLVAELRQTGEDFEFYPTTNEIIAALMGDVRVAKDRDYHWRSRSCSVMDIGAGSGKVLAAFRDSGFFSSYYAIEKSAALCRRLDSDVFIVGTEFHEQSLVSKQVDFTFCNPPYSEFADWTTKIIRESASTYVYLVIPVRWKDSVAISDALAYREATVKVIGEFSFMEAEDRAARAKVNLLRITLSSDKDDAFDRFFAQQFGELKQRFEESRDVPEGQGSKRFEGLVVGANYPDRMVEIYNREMDHVQANYELVAKLDVSLLKEFDVTPGRILGCLKSRLAGLRNNYWGELFSNMKQVTDRLISTKRRKLLSTLQANGHVDFTVSNIHAVIIWVLKNANAYLDEQLIGTFEKMISKANVRNYKSNERPFVDNRWRYSDERPTHIALEYRIVLERVGGIDGGQFGSGGLGDSAGEYIGDLLTVAMNLGFDCETNDTRLERVGRREWKSGEKHTFDYTTKGKPHPLIEVRAFLNGNLHLRLNQKFALALNVEYGRLKGWLGSGKEAAEELGDNGAIAHFQSSLQLGGDSLLMLSSA